LSNNFIAKYVCKSNTGRKKVMQTTLNVLKYQLHKYIKSLLLSETGKIRRIFLMEWGSFNNVLSNMSLSQDPNIGGVHAIYSNTYGKNVSLFLH
jgi:hypothetical protein